MGNVDRLLEKIREVLLDGKKFPHGRPFDVEKEVKEGEFTVPRVIEVYDSLEQNDPRMQEIHYMARTLDRNSGDYWFDHMRSQFTRIHEIAQEGRQSRLKDLDTVEQRTASARLFDGGVGIFSAQATDPKRGCSASVCINCYEPIAFCDYTCPTCEYDLISSTNMPTIEDWEAMSVRDREQVLHVAYSQMVSTISSRGDWRGQDSPFNKRFYDGETPVGGLVRIR